MADEMEEREHETEREEALPEHEKRPEGRTGGGLTSFGISAEQHGPTNDDVLEARSEEEEARDSERVPPTDTE